MMRAGAASRDITPALRGDFFGYVRPDLRVRGVALRLHAHALVLDDGARRVGLLTLDLGAPLVTAEILARVADLGYHAGNLLIAATHTHAGPNKPGEWVAQQAAAALRAAHEAAVPARGAWAAVRLDDANHNRSLEAHLANHGLDLYPGTGAPGLDPHGDDHPRDVTLRLLRVETTDGRPLAAWAHFAAHPTTFAPANRLFSSDYPGAATRHFRARFADAPVAIFTNGTEGDLVPRYDEPNQHALADRMGRRVAGAMARAWDAAGPGAELSVDGAVRRVVYAGQEIEPGKRVARRAWFGLPFIGGAENGPSFFYALGVEGKRRPRLLAGPVHGRRLVVAPAPWPSAADVTVLRVGDRLLLGVPGEPSVEAGRRMCAAALAAAGGEVTDALVVGLAQGYRGYFTTPEEYDQQHYEGGHTVFGRHTSLLVQHAHAELAAALAGSGAETAAVPAVSPSPPVSPSAAVMPAAVPSPVGHGGRPRLRTQPPWTVARFDTVEWSWRATPQGRDRPLDTPYLVLERLADDGGVEAVDDDLGVAFVWEQRRMRATARYEIPGDLPPGRYRFRIGDDAGAVTTHTFSVTVSTGLRLRGAVVEDGTIVFRAQHPPPDPLRTLRARETAPVGGTVRFVADGETCTAAWDAARSGWVAQLDRVPATVEVSAGGLTDGAGNHSGAAVTLAVGTLLPLDWPPAMGPGGGRCPAPFGLGSAGKPAPWTPSD